MTQDSQDDPTAVPIRDESQSAQAARDDDLTDVIGIESVADHHEVSADDLPTVSSPAWRPPRQTTIEPGRLPSADSAEAPPPYTPATAASLEAGHTADSATTDADSADGPDSTGRKSRKSAKKSGKGTRRKAPWWELPLLVGIAVLVAVVVKTFFVQPFYIPSQSMEKTLHGCPGCSGDRILVNKIIYDFRDPHPGDIVVFNAPKGWNDEPASKPPSNPVVRLIRGAGQLVGFVPPDGLIIVKRVIATGGQTVKGDAAGNVMVSDHGDAGPWRTLHEPFVYETGQDPAAVFGPVTVPKGRLWVMGDHRDESADSRYHCNPGGAEGTAHDGPDCDTTSSTVPISAVIGKAVVIAWPPSRWRTLGTPSTFQAGAAAIGSGAVPFVGSALFVVPVFVARRRKRRHPEGRRGERGGEDTV